MVQVLPVFLGMRVLDVWPRSIKASYPCVARCCAQVHTGDVLRSPKRVRLRCSVRLEIAFPMSVMPDCCDLDLLATKTNICREWEHPRERNKVDLRCYDERVWT